MAQGQEVFSERIARLHEQHAADGRSAAARLGPTGQSALSRQLGYISSVLCAGFIGFFSVLLARLVLFQIFGPPDPAANTDVTMITEGAIAMTVTCVIGYALRLRTSSHMIIASFGFWVGLLCMHNLVHHNPNSWEALFSERWVWHVTQMTEPNSIYFRGKSIDISGMISFGDESAAKTEIKINRF